MGVAESFDYIVVGGGSAGGFLTLRLSENADRRLLLQEAESRTSTGPSA